MRLSLSSTTGWASKPSAQPGRSDGAPEEGAGLLDWVIMVPAGRLLIVDDEIPVLEVLSEYFVAQGYVVDTASSGEVALSAVSRRRPDLILLDMRMPGIDGVETLRRLRALDASLPVIMVTANEDVTLARETLQIGAFDYVAKPFDFAYLERTVSAGLMHAGVASTDWDKLDGGDEPWQRLARAVFHAVRTMAEAGRVSTGTRLEAAALAAARDGHAGRADLAAEHLGEITLLVSIAAELGDLAGAELAAVEAAVNGAPRASSPAA
jgi:DNA-binding response OmpR family regulator